jgi:CelD/BcsL family acetyltransferase involved in cellulose biosynthesis
LPWFALSGDRLRYVPIHYDRHYIEFRGRFTDYTARFSAKSRSTMKRKIRKFAELSGGTIDFREYRTAADMTDFHRLATELSRKTYQERIFGEGFASQAGTLSTICDLAERDKVRGYMLFHRMRPVAYVFGRSSCDTLLYGLLGYDPEYRQYSPGDVLLWHLIEREFERGRFRYLDFGEGESWYKSFFSTGSIRCARVYFLPKTPLNFAAVLLHAGSNAFTNVVGRLAQRLALRDRMRRLLRERAAVQNG